MAGWKGAPLTKVRNCLTARMGPMRAEGAVIQPIFHPVVLKVLPPLEMLTVRSQPPGRLAIGVCATPSNTRCS